MTCLSLPGLLQGLPWPSYTGSLFSPPLFGKLCPASASSNLLESDHERPQRTTTMSRRMLALRGADSTVLMTLRLSSLHNFLSGPVSTQVLRRLAAYRSKYTSHAQIFVVSGTKCTAVPVTHTVRKVCRSAATK
jgi:hypothetical protein